MAKSRLLRRAAPHNAKAARSASRTEHHEWRTAITQIEPNKILVRGYPLDELMGRVSFAETIHLLLMGELPSPSIGRLMEALLVSSIDHGATPPSTLAARNVATTGAPLRASVAAGVLAFGTPLGGGGAIEACLHFLNSGLELVRQGVSYEDAANGLVERHLEKGEVPPGFGHRFHTRDPRAARLFQMALEFELEGAHIQMIRAVDRVLAAHQETAGERPLPINIDGAIAAVCGDLGLDAEIGNILFIIARVPGIVAHAHEEQKRQPPMREIDPRAHVYDGPKERRPPETRR
jgi:citrate synthase